MENSNEVSAQSAKGALLGSISSFVLVLGISALPFFFVPFAKFSFSFSKMMVFIFAVLIAALFWLIDRMRRGSLELPSGKLVLAALGVPAAYLLASLFSKSQEVSFFGQGFETETFFAILMVFAFMLLIPILFRGNKKLTKFYFGFFVSFAVISLFQIIRLIFGADILSFGGIFNNTVSNLVGKWNDLGIFFGLSAVLSLSTLEILKPSRLLKILLYVALGVSVIFMAVVNFTAVWVMLTIISLFFFVYKLMFGEHRKDPDASWSISKFFSAPSLTVFIISVVFVIAGGSIGDLISTKLNISQIEARPSWGTTFSIAGESIKEDLLFGAGPNRFVTEWLKNKPTGINNTIFWNSDFNSGIGTIPSAVTTTGIVGSIAWLAFLLLFLWTGLKSILMTDKDDTLARYIGVSSFLASIFLWVFSIFYVPNISIIALTALFSGIFIASQLAAGRIPVLRIDFLKNQKAGFITVFAIVVLLIGIISLGFIYTKKYISFVNFQSGIISFNQDGDITSAENKLLSAIRLSENDAYYRALTQLNIARLNEVVSQEGVSEDILRTQFQTVLGAAISNASRATEISPNNYQNWMSLGQVYASIVGLGIEGSYGSARSAYDRALSLNPHAPSIYLTIARLEAASGNNESAREMIGEAIREKSNYTEAVFFLSQIEIADGNTAAAIRSVESASTISPNEPTIFFQLGLLRYSNNQFKEAVSALERAVSLSSTYSNAKYFLGLSYYEIDRLEDAIGQFEDVQVLNPDNAEVATILTRLKDGLSPFEAVASSENAPEEREELPIEE